MRLKIETYLKEANCPDIVLANVDVDFCRGFIDFLRYAKNAVRRDGSVISNGAAHHHQAVLNGALNKAVRDGILSANPLKSISSKEKYQPTESMREYLTLEEMKAAMAAPCPHEDVKRAFLFCCFTGLRYSDVSVLTWRNIKQVNGGLVVSIQSMRKTEKQVIIPLNQSALKWLPDRNGCKPGQKVFDMTRLSTCDRCLKKMAVAAGIEKKVSFHTARHSMATLSLTAGGYLYTVGKLLGHTSINSTQVYADVVMETKIEAVNRVLEYFSM